MLCSGLLFSPAVGRGSAKFSASGGGHGARRLPANHAATVTEGPELRKVLERKQAGVKSSPAGQLCNSCWVLKESLEKNDKNGAVEMKGSQNKLRALDTLPPVCSRN